MIKPCISFFWWNDFFFQFLFAVSQILYWQNFAYMYVNLQKCRTCKLVLLNLVTYMSSNLVLTAMLLDRKHYNQGFWTYNIRTDKTLVCACVDNFKQNGIFWHQHLPAVRIWTWPKYNKHHHDLKNQVCRLVDMYIGKIFWPTAPCRGCPEKENLGTGLGRVWFVFWLRRD